MLGRWKQRILVIFQGKSKGCSCIGRKPWTSNK